MMGVAIGLLCDWECVQGQIIGALYYGEGESNY